MNPAPRTNPVVVIACVVVIIAAMKAATVIVVPFLLAVFIATIAASPVFWLYKHRVPLVVAVTLVIAAIIVVLITFGVFVGSNVTQFTENLPQYQERLSTMTRQLLASLENRGVDVPTQEIMKSFNPGTVMSLAGKTLQGFGGFISNTVLIVLTVVFILLEALSFPGKLRAAMGDSEQHLSYFRHVIENIRRYMGMKTVVSIFTGALVAIPLAILGLDFWLLWGVVAFLFNYIPNIGSIIAAIPAVLLALVQLSPGYAVVVAIIYVCVNTFMGNIIEPRYMGKGLGLSTLIVFLSLVFWGWVLGPVGMLLSVPLTMTVKMALEANPDTRWIAVLLGPGSPGDPPPPRR